jgi:hypothetical protein
MVVVCSLVAAFLMYRHLSYGLPFFYHPDELPKAVSAIKVVRGGIPTSFLHPHFMLFFSAPFIHLGEALGVPLLVAARASVATLGVATVGLLFIVGRSLAGPLTGFAAALLYATAPLSVVTAHHFKEDIPLAFWLTLQLLFLVRYLRNGSSRDLFLAAGALGGAMGTKYTGIISLPLVVGAVLLGPPVEHRWRMLAKAACWAAAVFLLTTPGILANPAAFIAGSSFEGWHAILGHGIKGVLDPGGSLSVESQAPGGTLRISPVSYLWTYHLRYSLIPGLSVAGVLLALVGTVMAAVRGDRAWRLVAISLGLFYLALETLPLKPPPFAARYMVVVLPYATLLAGGALALAWKGDVPRKALVGLLFVATIVLNGYQSLQQVQAMQPETRDEARSWIFRNLPPGARIIMPGLVWYTPFGGASQQVGPYNIVAIQQPSFSELLTASLDPRAYLLVSSFNYQRHLDFPDVDPDASRFYRMLFEQYTPLATFSVPFRPLGYHNPVIQVFHLGGAPPALNPRP